MIEESQRTQSTLGENLKAEDADMELTSLGEAAAQPLEVEREVGRQETETSGSRFFIELLICSILLWALLFAKQNVYGQSLLSQLKPLLVQEIESETLQNFISEAEEAIKQIL